jgi:endonuclease III
VAPGAPADRLARILDALEARYGAIDVTTPARPYELLILANCGYPASERACAAGHAALVATVGVAPDAILRAPKRRLVAALRKGGIVPELRAERLREIAESATRAESNPDSIAALSGAAARKLLKTFPTIGDPGADRILLLSHTEPVAAVPSNATQVPLRLGFGDAPETPGAYAAGYRAARAALDQALPRSVGPRIRAYALLKRHGEELCKRTKPLCDRCPVAGECPYPGKLAAR